MSLAELNEVAAEKRRDTKYILGEGQLGNLLAALRPRYRVLDLDGRRTHHYRTIYFDCPSLEFYRAHHAGRPRRVKVRSRLYSASGTSFLEIKQRAGSGHTLKHRLPTTDWIRHLTPSNYKWLESQLAKPLYPLLPQLDTSYERVTLVGDGYSERLTIDTSLSAGRGSVRSEFRGLAIVELKQNVGGASPFTAIARGLNARRVGFSKYCMGMARLHPELKQNNFNLSMRRAGRFDEEMAT